MPISAESKDRYQFSQQETKQAICCQSLPALHNAIIGHVSWRAGNNWQ
jgi:hypothetical protein